MSQENHPARSDQALLSVSGLKKYFPVRSGVFSRVQSWVKAVDGVSFDLQRGETLGLVGESGCGKTTVGRTLLNLLPPTAGTVEFDGQDVFSLRDAELKKMRRRMQIIFQDPYGSLNPRLTVGGIVGEGLAVHGLSASRGDRMDRVATLLQEVGLQPDHVNRYPHEFSGGQRQRIGIARALALDPEFIVCDEAVSALDVSIQAQIINLLSDLQRSRGLSYLFIAHDLSVVEHLSTRVAVMYLGKIVEMATADDLYAKPLHPYTRALMSAVPVPEPGGARRRIVLSGDMPSPMNPPSGCHFHTRCQLRPQLSEADQRRCVEEVPALADQGEKHKVACHFASLAVEGKVEALEAVASRDRSGGRLEV